MTEPKTEKDPSLLPYLNGVRKGVHFEIAAQGQAPAARAIESTGPFALVYEGGVSAGEAGGLADLFLLVQPDRYHLQPSELHPINNVQVERLWQCALARTRGQQTGAFRPVLKEQLDDQGNLLALRPLFRCAYRERWCHPPCPHCGQALTVCREDGRLQAAGLPAYSQSLERYLYCPACATQPDQNTFYAPTRPPSAPEGLKDGGQLLEGFSRQLSNKALADELPCVGCPETTNCYGPQTLVRERMRPLFFYPFFMLMMPAPSINLLEFTALLSGQGPEEILRRLDRQAKPGRMTRFERVGRELPASRGLLFPDDDRRFLEVLYLKLNLLAELFALVPQDETQLTEPVGRMSLESIWVDLPLQSARLPWFWNFSLRLIDPVGEVDHGPSKSLLPVSRRLHFFGAAWWYVLLAGAGQGMDAVWAAADRLAQHPEAFEPGENIDLEAVDPVFSTRHLLTDGAALRIDPLWAAFWRRAVLMGGELLEAASDPDRSWSEASFQQGLDLLRQEIRQALFKAPAAVSPADRADQIEANADADGAIGAILKSMLQNWPSASAQFEEKETLADRLLKAETTAPAEPNEDGDFVETVILGKADAADTPTDAGMEAPPDLEKTVMINRGAKPPGAKPSDQVGSGPTAWSTDLEQTVVMSGPERPDSRADDLEKTVILGSPPAAGRNVPGADRVREDEARSPDEEDLEKTVVMQPSKPKERKPKP